MSSMKQKGFAAVELILVAVAILVVAVIAARVYQSKIESDDDGSEREPATQVEMAEESEESKPTDLIWQFRSNAWSATETPPACPEPLPFQLPSDLEPATMALWPGQVRGEFKAHGGVRYDNSGGKVEIRAPLDGILYRAASYAPAVSNDTQYVLDFINNCGIAYRFDHLRVLAPKLEKVLADLGPVDESSATEQVGPVFIKQGELLATQIGFSDIQNYFYDLGVYDLRQKNSSAQDPAWAASHAPEFTHYGVCWFDLLSDEQNQTLRSLPTGNEGKTSDYC